ncbi:MAG: histidine kinase [Spirochaetes bacterium GWD1_27_9]|nr:MAG: histidine kinase [Spirochaetes bacterium GWB1_27_13]OHD23228.1 MAG: histidine kinase [Spirochaetes bacterium GWC1_27_15]OHD42058.1 MAG: histidine kinase [Spirochaetes bacterium GWD1_27_9]
MREISILLVEDEVIIAMLMQKEIMDIGYKVSNHVTTGENAIVIARQNPPDIILMDIRLAGKIDGIDAASVIKSELDIPVIFITCYDDQSIRDRTQILKPLGYLIKPLEIYKLKTIIDNYFA